MIGEAAAVAPKSCHLARLIMLNLLDLSIKDFTFISVLYSLTPKFNCMNYLQRIELWGDTHHSKWLDIVRVGLGVFLIYKAISFLMNMSTVIGLFNQSNTGFGSFTIVLLSQFIVIVHLMGGLLIMIGIHTRLACLIQVPILIGAIVLLYSSGNVNGWELATSIMVLMLLIAFLVYGNGPWSFNKMSGEDAHK
jgi:putative oxidoreductase